MSSQIRVRVTPAMVVAMCRLRDEGVSYEAIGKAFDVSRGTARNYVERHLEEQRAARSVEKPTLTEEVKPEPSERTAATVHGAHLEQYKRFHRGGRHVPAEREIQYVELLKTGMPVAQALERVAASGRGA